MASSIFTKPTLVTLDWLNGAEVRIFEARRVIETFRKSPVGLDDAGRRYLDETSACVNAVEDKLQRIANPTPMGATLANRNGG